MDWTKILLAVLTIIGAVITGMLIPWFKSKLNEDQLNKLDYWLRIFIAAAETAFGNGTGEAKKQWVLERIKSLGLNFDAQAVSDAIDALCRELTAAAVINTDKLEGETT
jgi:hypothetical protein